MRRSSGLVVVAFLLTGVLAAQRPPLKEERIGDGYLIQVLEPGAMAAVVEPQFISAEEADKLKLLKDDEPVLGVFDGQVAKAYSLWHLDRHEVVNDATPALGAIAVTW